ncbi:MAG: hypothetical protein GX838_01645 [Clostridiaceae bacterium]|nr:hypothetical protein [Clostridiaceae bacterium]
MARYCFYCGRELEDNEKCDCRTRSGVTGGSRNTSSANREWAADHSAADKEPGRTSSDPFSSGNWQHREENIPPKRKRKNQQDGASSYYSRTPADRARHLQSFLRFFAAPADTMSGELSPHWTRSHSIWLAVTVALSGLHYMVLNRSLTALVTGQGVELSVGESLLSWLTGSVFIGLILILFTLTLWLLARFLYRQGGLPFLHALAAGRTSWKYLTLFFLLALPSLFTGGAVYGFVLALMGLVFAVMVHAKQVAALTHLDENRTWQLSYLAIIIFSGILSSVTTLVRMLNVVK